MPFGILVVGSNRRLTSANSTARELLSDANGDWPRGPTTCCDLLGCRQADGLSEHCITELALDAEKPLPEIRLDLPAEEPTLAVWVAASRLGDDSERVMIHLRRGRIGDRRRRTKPHWMTDPQLNIDALGETRVRSGDTALSGDWLLRKPGELLKFLVCQQRRPVHVDEIVEALSPGAPADMGRNRLRHLVHVLRERVEPGRPRRKCSSFIVSVGSTYALDPRVGLDVDEFEEAIRGGLRGPSRSATEREGSAEAIERAMDLYRGDLFADDIYNTWSSHERERLKTMAYDGLVWLVQHYRMEGDLGSVHDYLERAVALWPLDTKVHQALIALHLERGRRDAAVRRYEILAERLNRELGVVPDFDLSDCSPSPGSTPSGA